MKNSMKGHPRFWDLWLWKCGLPEEADKKVKPLPDLDVLRKTEWSKNFEAHMRAALRFQPELGWSKKFEQLMRDGLIMGAFRYGMLNSRGKPQFDRTGSAVSRMQVYHAGGDLWQLVDIANMCLLEFEEGYEGDKNRIAANGGLRQVVRISPGRIYEDTFHGGDHSRLSDALDQYRNIQDPSVLPAVAAAMMIGFVKDRHPKRHISMGDAVIHTKLR